MLDPGFMPVKDRSQLFKRPALHVDVPLKPVIIAPLHHESHRTFATIDVNTGAIRYYDS